MSDPSAVTSELVRIDDQLGQLKSTTKECAARRKELLVQLQQHMEETGQTQMNVQGKRIELRTKTVKVPLNEAELARILCVTFHGDLEKASNVAKFVLEERETKETTYLHVEP